MALSIFIFEQSFLKLISGLYRILSQTSTSRLVIRNIKPFQVSFKQSTPTYNKQLIINNKHIIIDSNDSQMSDISKERLKR